LVVAANQGWMTKPSPGRWASKPTALHGGVAIAASALLGFAWLRPAQAIESRALLFAATTATLAAALGLWDDLRPLRPRAKLAGQLISSLPAALAVAMLSGWSGVAVPYAVLTALCVIALQNSVNLTDNMDGLAAGLSAVSGTSLSLVFFQLGSPTLALAAACVAVACLGFLQHNFRLGRPARIFMGDSGSLFLGSLLAALIALAAAQAVITPTLVIVLALNAAVPIFDTLFVIVTRLSEGRPISEGGRDHLSHRMVFAGLSSRMAVVTLWLLQFASSCLSIVLLLFDDFVGNMAVLAGITFAFFALGRRLKSFAPPSPPTQGIIQMPYASNGTRSHDEDTCKVLNSH
jgi:UDP-GlcNAc:undecaprenyl-phosphate GlcNAc-1-phosphate transferase